jgi:glycine cleavage system regulatory protein
MCRLGGEFAGVLRISIPSHRKASLLKAVEGLLAQGISIVVRPDANGDSIGASNLMSVEVVGQDRPGIVRQIAAALSGRGINVEELTTECGSAPMSGEMLFKALARVHVPPSCNLQALRADLERIASDLLVDVRLVAEKPAETSK